MIVDEEVDIGDVGRQRDLVQEDPETTAALTASISRQGFCQSRSVIARPEASASGIIRAGVISNTVGWLASTIDDGATVTAVRNWQRRRSAANSTG